MMEIHFWTNQTELLPPLSEGANVEIVTVETTSGMTSPPSYLTEAELIALVLILKKRNEMKNFISISLPHFFWYNFHIAF